MKLKLSIFISSIFLALSIEAQISIDQNLYLPAFGTEIQQGFVSVDSTKFYNLINGTGYLDFDFSDINIMFYAFGTSVDPLTAPYIDSFPTANFVLYQQHYEGGNWLFYNSSFNLFQLLGSYNYNTFDGEIFTKTLYSRAPFEFPLEYGDQWGVSDYSLLLWKDSIGNVYGTSEHFDTTIYKIDAYGQAIYNYSSIPCLRVRKTNKHVFKRVENGEVIDTNTTFSKSADFITNGFDVLATVKNTIIDDSTIHYSVISQSKSLFDPPTDIINTDKNTLPVHITLSQNFPNPFNPTTEIHFSISQKTDVKLEIFNISGQLIDILVDRNMSAGTYSIEWDGKSKSNSTVSSGIYLYKLTTNETNETKKMILLK